MKKIIFVFLLNLFISIANASIPLLPPSGPGGGIVDSMRAQEELRRQELENQRLSLQNLQILQEMQNRNNEIVRQTNAANQKMEQKMEEIKQYNARHGIS